VNVPPVAKRVLCIDFDGTIVPWGSLTEKDIKPLLGAVEAVRAFKDAGYRIVIFTSRLSQAWWFSHCEGSHADALEFGSEQRRYVVDALIKNDVPYDELTAEKVPAEYYIDDRAIEFKNNWEEIGKRVLGV
jgi:hypothetical protein